jgi:hypothetical protein
LQLTLIVAADAGAAAIISVAATSGIRRLADMKRWIG